MILPKKGFLSLDFLVPNLGLLLSIVLIEGLYAAWVRPRANDLLIERRAYLAQGSAGSNAGKLQERHLALIIKDREPQIEIIFCFWGVIFLTYKLIQLRAERRLLEQDFVRVQPGERILPEDALDRYKELKSAVERNPRWRERLLPECLLAALHRFHATSSVQDAAMAAKERSELTADQLDSSLSLVRYIAWAIPAIGFVGTVRGIGDGLTHAEEAIKGDISTVTSQLGLAFNSTFVGLMLCILLMYLIHVVQSGQESFIIETQTYCRDRLVDVMKVPTKDESAGILS
jgi:biopolymer transport protein ExbB/TolQ